MAPSNSDSAGVSLAHDDVLARFEEVASLEEYPFERPEFQKPKDKSLRINLKSNSNLFPVLQSAFLLLFNILCPLLTVFLSILGFVFYDGASQSSTFLQPSSWLFALAAICMAQMMYDPFLLHYISNGLLGGLGCGDGDGRKAKDGFFCSNLPNNQRFKKKLEHFVNYKPTPYFFSGDLLTLMPFLLFKGSRGGKVAYKRYWIKVPSAPAPDGDGGPSKRPNDKDDSTNEAVALDIVFPPEGYNPEKPTFLILHGLNGGSTEPYVLDLARRATKEGHTVAVLINRGLMKTHIRGMDSFHGARTSDVGCAVDTLLYALGGEKRGNGAPRNSRIVLVGFSMGAIIAANYTAKSKEHSGLAGAVCFSGTLCSEKMLLTSSASRRSMLWQPLLAFGLKATIIKPNMATFAKRGITARDVEAAKTVMDIDRELVCRYHGYPTVQDYYHDMSAGGRGDEKGIERLQGTKVPLLAVHALDDPIAIFEVVLAEHIEKTDNVMLLATKHGGHIGWPQGTKPSKQRWSFMMDVAMEFAAVAMEAK